MADFTLDPALGAPAWFAEHSLITNSTIRNYLKQYSQHAWPEVTKLTLIYGITALQHNYKDQTLSLHQLKQAVQSSATTLVVQSNVPQLQRQILSLQSQLDNVFDKLEVQPLQEVQAPLQASNKQQQLQARPPPRKIPLQPTQMLQQQQQWQRQQPTPPAEQHQKQEQAPPPFLAAPRQSSLSLLRARQGRGRNPAITAPKPSDAWRQGEPSGYTSPPRANRRSQDNQGATNPIYPDWWLTEPTAEQLAEQQRQRLLLQQQQQKPPRSQPRLAYSVSKQQQQDITADDLVTAEYLVVPGSGYGQRHQQLVPSEYDAPLTVMQITPSNIVTSQAAVQQQQPRCNYLNMQRHDLDRQLPPPAAASVPSGRAASTGLHRQKAPVVGRGLPRLSRAESKIKQAVAASKQQAAAKQRHRQRLLSSVIATSRQREQQQQHPAAAGSEEERCPPAATAEQFIANPWTSWFLPGSAPDLAARSAFALAPVEAAEKEEREEEQQQHLEQQKPELANYSDTGPNSASLETSVGAHLMRLQSAAESTEVATAAAEGSRGALCDITLNLNQQQPVGAGSIHYSCKQQWEPLGVQGSDSSVASFAFAQAAVSASESSQQQQLGHARMSAGQHRTASQQQQAWAADFGHLDSAQLKIALREAQQAEEARGQQRQPHQRQLWSQKWVGNFGHLLTGPRFCEATAFHHHQAMADEDAAAGSNRCEAAMAADNTAATEQAPGSSTFFLSPAALDDMVVAGRAFSEGPVGAAVSGFAISADIVLAQDTDEQALQSSSMSLLQQWQHMAADAQARAQQGAADSVGDAQETYDAVAPASDLLRLHGEVRETSSPTKRQAAATCTAIAGHPRAVSSSGSSRYESVGLPDEGQEANESAAELVDAAELPQHADVATGAELADDYLAGLQDTSRMLHQALQQHNSVMQLVGFLDGEQGQQTRHEQQEAADAVVSSSTAAHTAAWVAATAVHKEHAE